MDNFDYKSYSGNNDFRGFLAKNFRYALDYTGNDGNIDINKVNGAGADTPYGSYAPGQGTKVAADIKRLYGNWQQANASLLYKPTDYRVGGYQAPAKAANYDVGGNYNSAYNEAAATQNPLYDKYLNQFLAQQANQKAAQQHTFDQTTSNLDTAFKNTQEANAIAQQRTGEDVARAEGQIATKSDQFQTDSGNQFANDRLQQASDLSKAGLTGGIGSQKTEAVQAARNTQEARQGAEFDQQKQGQELSKARTFEDLARSNKLAGESTATGKANAQFNLDNWIEAAKINEDAYRTKANVDRKQAIIEEAQRIASEKFKKFANSLSDPVASATRDKYGAGY